MNAILVVFAEIAVLVAVVFAGYLTLLLYRHPNHAKWLESETASTTVMILLMGAGIFGLAWLVKGLVQLNLDPLAAITLAMAVFIGIAWGFWKALRMRARLDAASAGRSPFRIGARALAQVSTKRAA
jgi:hypothetical protein